MFLPKKKLEKDELGKENVREESDSSYKVKRLSK
mgnify:CR=1 FL=1